MTEESKETAGGVARQIREWIIVGGSLVAIIGGVWLAMLWLTGGLKPQTQVDQDGFRTQLSSIQAAQEKSVTTNLAAYDRIIARLDALPRPIDYANQEAHLGRLDTALQAAYDRMTRIEIDAADRGVRIQSVQANLDNMLRANGAPGNSSSVRQPR
jgi:hypothetical protein